MNMDYSLLNKPIKYMTLYMMLVLMIYIFGPIRWNTEWDFVAVSSVVLISSYIVAMYVGYRVGLSRIHINNALESKLDICNNSFDKFKYKWLFNALIVLNLILTIFNALEYAGAISLSGLYYNAINGLLNPADVYYTKDTSSRAGNIIVWITLMLEPFLSMTRVMSLVWFKRISFNYKLLVVLSIIVEVLRWLAVGTNKGLMDVMMRIFIALWVISLQKQTFEKVRLNILKLSVSIMMLISFFWFFASSISARVGGNYNSSLFYEFPYNLIPENLQFFVEKFDSYLTQGYFYMTQCIRYCEFSWTFGIGNSRFAIDTVYKIFGINLFNDTYPAQLGGYGVDPLVSWHSAFAWFASDFTFFGVIIWMFLVGYYFSKITFETIYTGNPISVTLFYFIVLAIINSSCTNYVLAFSNMFVGFWGLVILRRLRNIKIIF